MKMNLKVRFKNPTFWLTVIPSLITLIYAILALFGVVPSITKEIILDVFMALMSALSTLGVFVDPTTPGVQDSTRAMFYNVPGGGSDNADV